MEAASNPCQAVVQQLTSLASIIKNVDKKVKDIERDVDVMGRSSVRDEEEEPSEAALQLREETKKLLEATRASNEDLKTSNRNFEEFLVAMVGQVQTLSTEFTEMEEHMAQYGYVAQPPLDPALFDIFRSDAPPAAADLPAAGDLAGAPPVEQAESDKVDTEGIKKLHENLSEITVPGATGGASVSAPKTALGGQSQFEIPSIFDIGLSAETLMLITGVANVKKAEPVHASAQKFVDSLKKSATKAARDQWVTHDRMESIPMESFTGAETTYNGSPILTPSSFIMGKFRPASREPYVPRQGPGCRTKATAAHEKQVSEENQNELVEISPGLFTRRQSTKKKNELPGTPARVVLNSDGLPETPELETINLRALLSKHAASRAENSKGIKMDTPAISDDVPTPEFLSQVLQNKISIKTPDTPELEGTY